MLPSLPYAITLQSEAYPISVLSFSEISRLLHRFPLTVESVYESLQAASSNGVEGPPNTHPDPIAISIAIPLLPASSTMNPYISIHSLERNGISWFSNPSTP